jgi:hypothetical protein
VPAARRLVAEEAPGPVAAGCQAVKLRLGDALNRDMERSRALRSALGLDVTLLADGPGCGVGRGVGVGVGADEDYLRAHLLTAGPAWR